MKGLCRQLPARSRRRRKLWQELFPHARIITDPKKLAQLNADLAQHKRIEEAESRACPRPAHPQPGAQRGRLD
jgi:hypothetical protein